jgi:oligosaccharyltransferase complex subunit epsilon
MAKPQPSFMSKSWQNYMKTPKKILMLDAYMVFVMLTGILQFVYMLLAGTYPYNSFLAGFIASVGSFVLVGNFLLIIFSQSENANRSQKFRFSFYSSRTVNFLKIDSCKCICRLCLWKFSLL